MLQTLPGFLENNIIYIAVIVLLCAVLSYRSETIRDYLKKGAIIFGIVFALIAGYELVTGNSIVNLPGSVDKKLSEQPKNPETGRRYYQSYEERYDGNLPKDK